MKRRQQGILTGMPFMANIASRTFVDDLGRKIYLPHPPHRIVSLAPHITEMLFALGAGDQVVAVTQFCDYPPEAIHKPKVGSMRPTPESLKALNSDLIIAPQTVTDPELIAELEQLKATLYVVEPQTVEEVLSHLHTIGRMLARTQAATQLVADMRRRIQHIKERPARLPHPRLLYVHKNRPLSMVGAGSVIHQLIQLAGAENIGARTGQPFPDLSMEEVMKLNPDVLLFPVGLSEEITESERQQWRRCESLKAARAGRLYPIDQALMERPGPRIAEALERLVSLLQPDAFPEISISTSPVSNNETRERDAHD
jgi:iron complex transport system substrate-binding protein